MFKNVSRFGDKTSRNIWRKKYSHVCFLNADHCTCESLQFTSREVGNLSVLDSEKVKRFTNFLLVIHFILLIKQNLDCSLINMNPEQKCKQIKLTLTCTIMDGFLCHQCLLKDNSHLNGFRYLVNVLWLYDGFYVIFQQLCKIVLQFWPAKMLQDVCPIRCILHSQEYSLKEIDTLNIGFGTNTKRDSAE